jgi:hypothetical protein
VTKRSVEDQIWLVEQPDHARVAGFLAAHWGNSTFVTPGSFADCQDCEYWREQALFAIAEHDNGWWDWEADPQIDPADGLPLDFLQISQEQALSHWRTGTRRFAQTHPFAALLISAHARLLQEPMLTGTTQPQLLSPLFHNVAPKNLNGNDAARAFVVEQQEFESTLLDRASLDAATRTTQEQGIEDAVLRFPKRGIPPDVPVRQDDFLMPHIRLLQITDAMSLMLCFGGQGFATIEETPRGSWEDRVTIEITPSSNRRIRLRPYPFDTDPLVASIPVRVLAREERIGDSYLAWRESTKKQLVEFEFTGD